MNEIKSKNLLIVDDEASIRYGLKKLFQRENYLVLEAEDSEQALDRFNKHEIDLVLLDIRLKGTRLGLELLKDLKGVDSETPIIIITGYGTIDSAVEAMKLGAVDYILKPIENKQILEAIRRAFEIANLKTENQYLRNELQQTACRHRVITRNSAMRSILDTADRLKGAGPNILISGESGVGKEVLARYLHFTGPRREHHFVTLNCAALSESLLHSELFGHVRGAFTGAIANKIGKFELAHRGTLFLDEIGDMPLEIQAKLLRVLEEKSFERMGGIKKIQVDTQIIAATNMDLSALVREGRFRQDLFFRLNVVSLSIPPLRERREDIVPLSEYFITDYCRRYRKSITGIDESGWALLKKYSWPGNVRELQNIITRAVLLSNGPCLSEADFSSLLGIAVGPPSLPPIQETGSFKERLSPILSYYEKRILAEELRKNNGNRTRTARVLDLSRKTLISKIKRYRIQQ